MPSKINQFVNWFFDLRAQKKIVQHDLPKHDVDDHVLITQLKVLNNQLDSITPQNRKAILDDNLEKLQAYHSQLHHASQKVLIEFLQDYYQELKFQSLADQFKTQIETKADLNDDEQRQHLDDLKDLYFKNTKWYLHKFIQNRISRIITGHWSKVQADLKKDPDLNYLLKMRINYHTKTVQDVVQLSDLASDLVVKHLNLNANQKIKILNQIIDDSDIRCSHLDMENNPYHDLSRQKMIADDQHTDYLKNTNQKDYLDLQKIYDQQESCDCGC